MDALLFGHLITFFSHCVFQGRSTSLFLFQIYQLCSVAFFCFFFSLTNDNPQQNIFLFQNLVHFWGVFYFCGLLNRYLCHFKSIRITLNIYILSINLNGHNLFFAFGCIFLLSLSSDLLLYSGIWLLYLTCILSFQIFCRWLIFRSLYLGYGRGVSIFNFVLDFRKKLSYADIILF